jgi:hypothetical protein
MDPDIFYGPEIEGAAHGDPIALAEQGLDIGREAQPAIRDSHRNSFQRDERRPARQIHRSIDQ